MEAAVCYLQTEKHSLFDVKLILGNNTHIQQLLELLQFLNVIACFLLCFGSFVLFIFCNSILNLLNPVIAVVYNKFVGLAIGRYKNMLGNKEIGRNLYLRNLLQIDSCFLFANIKSMCAKRKAFIGQEQFTASCNQSCAVLILGAARSGGNVCIIKIAHGRYVTEM